MDTTTAISLSFLCMLIGCFVGLAGWISGRDKKISNDAEWKGEVSTKLDIAIGMRVDVTDIKDEISDLTQRVVVVEQSTKQAHKRLDEHINKPTSLH